MSDFVAAKRDVHYVRELCERLMTDSLRIDKIRKGVDISEEDFRWASTLESKYSGLQEEFENPEFVESMMCLMEQDPTFYNRIMFLVENFKL